MGNRPKTAVHNTEEWRGKGVQNQKTTVQEVDQASGQNSEAEAGSAWRWLRGQQHRRSSSWGKPRSWWRRWSLEANDMARRVDREPRAALQVAGDGDRGLLAWAQQDQTMERWAICWALHMADSWLSQQWCKEAKRHWRLGLLCVTSLGTRDRVTPTESLKSLFICWIRTPKHVLFTTGGHRKI